MLPLAIFVKGSLPACAIVPWSELKASEPFGTGLFALCFTANVFALKFFAALLNCCQSPPTGMLTTAGQVKLGISGTCIVVASLPLCLTQERQSTL